MRKKITIHMPKKADKDREYFAMYACVTPIDVDPIRETLDELDGLKHCAYTIELLQRSRLGDKVYWIFTMRISGVYQTYFNAWFKYMFGTNGLANVATIHDDYLVWRRED